VFRLSLGFGLIAENTVSEVSDIKTSERGNRICQQFGVRLSVVEIDNSGADVGRPASLQVSSNNVKLVGIPCDEEEAGALLSPDTAGGFGDAGCSSENEDLLRGAAHYSPSALGGIVSSPDI